MHQIIRCAHYFVIMFQLSIPNHLLAIYTRHRHRASLAFQFVSSDTKKRLSTSLYYSLWPPYPFSAYLFVFLSVLREICIWKFSALDFWKNVFKYWRVSWFKFTYVEIFLNGELPESKTYNFKQYHLLTVIKFACLNWLLNLFDVSSMVRRFKELFHLREFPRVFVYFEIIFPRII